MRLFGANTASAAVCGVSSLFLELEPVFNNVDAALSFAYDFDAGDADITTPVHVDGRVVNRTGVVSLEATALFDYAALCALCCKPLVRHATVPVKHFLLAEPQGEDDDAYIRLDTTRLNLDELVLEDIWLSIPSKFLCREACRGLCPTCGIDLNEGTCACQKASDPRLAALSELLGK